MADVIQWREEFGEGRAAALRSSLRQVLEGRVSEAWIFGSFAQGEATKASDVDLLVVAETERPFWERPRLFDDLYEIHPRLDLLVYTPGEMERMMEDDSPFWRSVRGSRVRLV